MGRLVRQRPDALLQAAAAAQEAMSAQDHLKRCIEELRGKQRAERRKELAAKISAETYDEAIAVLEVELSRLPQVSSAP